MVDAVGQSTLQQTLSDGQTVGISFALGLPAQEALPAVQLAIASERVLSESLDVLQYRAPLRVLKNQIVALMQKRGVHCSADEVVLTSGAQQGLALVSRLLLAKGYAPVAEELTFPGFRQLIEMCGSQARTVPANSSAGLDATSFEAILKSVGGSGFAYVVAEGHNPLGRSMSVSGRRALVDLARRLCAPIIEDDSYGFLQYDPPYTAPLRALDSTWVYYVGSFSKTIAPSLRTGWIIAPIPDVAGLEALKEASDVNTAALGHHISSAFLDAEDYSKYIERISSIYRTRRDVMVASINRHFRDQAYWVDPRGGFFVWIELSGQCDTRQLLSTATTSDGVSAMPGEAFRIGSTLAGANGLRLSFSNCPISQIDEGIRRLASVLIAGRASNPAEAMQSRGKRTPGYPA